MANDKISQLTDGSPLQSTDFCYIIRTTDGGITWNPFKIAMGVFAPLFLNTTQSGTTYTLAAIDANTLIDLTNSSGCAVTVPPNSSVAYPIGTQIALRCNNSAAAQCSVVAGAGVTINSKYGYLKFENTQFAKLYLLKTGTDTWDLGGDLSS